MSCVIVMGCYRTGTSAVAGILHHLGVNMGENFQEPNVQNPKGFFEDPEFVEANLKMYEGSCTGDNSNMIEGKNLFYGLCIKRQKLSWSSDDDGHWGFKDPKFCLTAKHVELHSDSKIIWIHRDIDETALSIIKSLGLHGADANMDKWRTFVKHYRDETREFTNGILTGTLSKPILHLSLSKLLAAPRTYISEIAHFIGSDTTQEAFDFMEQ